jgi:hypothetical protein
MIISRSYIVKRFYLYSRMWSQGCALELSSGEACDHGGSVSGKFPHRHGSYRSSPP